MTLREISRKLEKFMNANPNLVDVDVAGGEEEGEFVLDFHVTNAPDSDGTPRPYIEVDLEWR